MIETFRLRFLLVVLVGEPPAPRRHRVPEGRKPGPV